MDTTACAKNCIMTGKMKGPCENCACRHFIDYVEDDNCSLVTVEKHECEDGLFHEQISERMGMPRTTVIAVEQRAIKKLRQYMKKNNMTFSMLTSSFPTEDDYSIRESLLRRITKEATR